MLRTERLDRNRSKQIRAADRRPFSLSRIDRDASPKAASRFSGCAPTVRLAGCPHNLTFCGASGLGGHRVLDQADNGREYDTADTAASQLTDNAVENGIETAAG